MTADRLVYCLEQISDYSEFERLCSDLMVAAGYARLEPLGGTNDAGRDAVLAASNGSRAYVFAYSVRGDWRRKLAEDCEKTRTHGHPCDVFVFCTTARISASERDDAVLRIKRDYGWDLELFPMERLRLLLTHHAAIIAKHPGIFTPPFFERRAGVTLVDVRDIVLIDAAPADNVLASWLSRRLMLQGYKTWSSATAPLAGHSEAETISALINCRAAKVISILSEAARTNPDNSAHRVQAAQLDLLVPVTSSRLDWAALDSFTRRLTPIRFEEGWASGLRELLTVLHDAGVPEGQATRAVDYRAFVPIDPIVSEPEELYSKEFEVLQIPPTILHYRASDRALLHDLDQITRAWPAKRAGRVFFSFFQPTAELHKNLGLSDEHEIDTFASDEVEGIRVRDIRIELVRRTLTAHCIFRRLSWCHRKEELYFPPTPEFGRLAFALPNGQQTWLKCWGERSFWRPGGGERYRYALSPHFVFIADRESTGRLMLRVRIRVTDDQGELLPDRIAFTRRRRLAATWYNEEWFKRTIAIARHLESEPNKIIVKMDQRPDAILEVRSVPLRYLAPIRLNEQLLRDSEALREDVLALDADERDEEEADTSDD